MTSYTNLENSSFVCNPVSARSAIMSPTKRLFFPLFDPVALCFSYFYFYDEETGITQSWMNLEKSVDFQSCLRFPVRMGKCGNLQMEAWVHDIHIRLASSPTNAYHTGLTLDKEPKFSATVDGAEGERERLATHWKYSGKSYFRSKLEKRHSIQEKKFRWIPWNQDSIINI